MDLHAPISFSLHVKAKCHPSCPFFVILLPCPDVEIPGILLCVLRHKITSCRYYTTGKNALQGKHISLYVTDLNSKIINKITSSDTRYAFPTSNSAISGNNDKYTVLHTGIAFFRLVFNNTQYSQIGIYLNGISIAGGNISSGDVNAYGFTQIIPIPVHKDDVLSVTFYNQYTVREASVQVLY